MQILDNPVIEWKMEYNTWIPYLNNEPIPFDWVLKYTCEKCGKLGRDSIFLLKKRGYEAICKKCRSGGIKSSLLNPWIEVDGHKIQGPFEDMVAQWLVNHNIRFQTHGEIEKTLYVTGKNGKKRKFMADFYLPDYDIILEPHSIANDESFDKKIEELSKQCEIYVLTWNGYQNELDELVYNLYLNRSK